MTDIEVVRCYIAEQFAYHNNLLQFSVNDSVPSDEDPDFEIVIKGVVYPIMGKVAGNYIDGEFEQYDTEDVTNFDFVGTIEVINEDGEIQKTIQLD